MASAQEETRKMLNMQEVVALVETRTNMTDKSDKEKLDFYELKHDELLRKKFVNLIDDETFRKHIAIALDCVNFYRRKLGYCSFEQELEIKGMNDNSDPNELLMINPDLKKYIGTEEFMRVPIIVPAPTQRKPNESS